MIFWANIFLRVSLEKERDCIHVKDKIIDDQGHTIHQLKGLINEKNEEIAKADLELKRILSDLNRSTDEAEQIRLELDDEKREKVDMILDIAVKISITIF